MKLPKTQVTNLKTYKILRECATLLKTYANAIDQYGKAELNVEINRWAQEYIRYPEHMLTVYKGLILLEAANRHKWSEKDNDTIARIRSRVEAQVCKSLERTDC